MELIRDGKVLEQNLDKEMLTEEELQSQLRLHEVENYAAVKRATLEGDGRLSVIKA